jgi:hypothetical protein
MTMTAYHNDPAIKGAILAQLAAHRQADELIKGKYWEDGKGCAVGCTLHSYAIVTGRTDFGFSDHAVYDDILGHGGQMLGRLGDKIFEGLPNGKAVLWPERFMSAFVPGGDYSRVGWQFLHWLLTDVSVNPGIDHPLVRDAVKQCADVVHSLSMGQAVAESAARSARSAVAASAAAAWAARSAAGAAESASWSAASSAAGGASAAYTEMAGKLIELIEATP